MAKIPVKVYKSTDQGAPQMDNAWGDLIKVLDACLVNGYNEQNVTSITASGATVTVTVAAAHGYSIDDVIEISGANEADFNGEWRVASVESPTKLTFIMTGTATAGTGTIKIKRPGLGFEKPFGDNQTGAYRSTNPESSRMFLRVDDRLKPNKGFGAYNTNWLKWANVGIVEDMTSFDNMIGAQCPFDPADPKCNWESTQANQFGWYKWYHSYYINPDSPDSYNSVAGNKSWIIIGDDRLFYLIIDASAQIVNYGSYSVCYCFGDVIKEGNQKLSAFINAHNRKMMNYSQFYGGNQASAFMGLWHQNSMVAAPFKTNGLPIMNELYMSASLIGLSLNGGMQMGDRTTGIDVATYSHYVSRMYVIEKYTNFYFGQLPGMLFSHISNSDYGNRIFYMSGNNTEKYIVIPIRYANTSSSVGMVVFDITGNWR